MLDEFIIHDVDTLKALAHPQRLEILRQLEEPRTVKEVAERMDADPTKLYYHVRILEKAGVIAVTETNIVSGIIEKTFQLVAKSYRVAEGLVVSSEAAPGAVDQVARAIFDNTLQLLRQSLEASLVDFGNHEGTKRSAALLGQQFRLTDAQQTMLGERMQALMDDLVRWTEENKANEDVKDSATEFAFTIAFFPLKKK